MDTSFTASLIKKREPHHTHRMHPNSLANLKPYKPGQNGNPKPGNSLKAVLLNALLEPLKEPPPSAPARDHIVYATLKGAITCEPTSAHLKEVWDRVEGKVPGDQPPVTQDNRVLNIIVLNEDTKQLIEGIADWTRKPQVGADGRV